MTKGKNTEYPFFLVHSFNRSSPVNLHSLSVFRYQCTRTCKGAIVHSFCSSMGFAISGTQDSQSLIAQCTRLLCASALLSSLDWLLAGARWFRILRLTALLCGFVLTAQTQGKANLLRCVVEGWERCDDWSYKKMRWSVVAVIIVLCLSNL
ncbi:hypothetical protein E3N88_01084 [Mikania micrantha]|uniref:Uncharacterized protein n=1 Tax=Mikania micrantha TaxID=192012 RepID=A0A5N6Q2B0_9ASTR|nr:hypothetical protein E3N88_01084 [Mikania micrantha]